MYFVVTVSLFKVNFTRYGNLYVAKFGRSLFHGEVKGILSNIFQALGEHLFCI